MIVVEKVSKSFGGLTALDHCSLEIEAGRITGIIGPNGAGKSTLFNIIAGSEKADSGRVFFDGRDITGAPPHRLFGMGLLRTFQVPQEFKNLTVRENLMVVPPDQSGENLALAWFRWGRVRRENAEILRKADEVLAFLNLDQLADELADNLSAGQKKLLELGRTMMTDARVVLLDEPGAGVNPTLMAKLRDAIRSLNTKRGYTFCIIEHDMDLVAELCDPVIVLAQGTVLARGTMDEVRANPDVLEAYFGGSTGAAA
jgi:branched-chain amino acid transport system ATP-binding protein